MNWSCSLVPAPPECEFDEEGSSCDSPWLGPPALGLNEARGHACNIGSYFITNITCAIHTKHIRHCDVYSK